jgi:hypothetical protein
VTVRAEQRASLPLAAYREDPLLFLLTLGAAVTSIAALLLQVVGIIRMPYTLSFLTAPGMIFLLCVQVWAGSARRPLIVNRLRVGFVAGLIGLLAYNGARWVLGALLSSSPFYSIVIFGKLITAHPAESITATVAGWLYHISNGLTFGIIYTLIVGPARWWFGLAWGLVLELAMLMIYPASTLLQPRALAPFVIVSLASHALFGAVIGVVAQEHALARGSGMGHG